MRTNILLALGMLAAIAASGTPAGATETIAGTATYRERIALPPHAVFEATLEDVSRADAAAKQVGRTTIDSPGQPPIAFSIAYDPAAIDQRATYAVRARVLVGDRLMFTSDRMTPVLTRGAPNEVDIVMRMVGRQGSATDGAAATAPAATAVEPAPATPAPVIGGMFVYMADAARLTDCRSGASYPVAMEADYLRLEQAYTAARAAPGKPLMVTFEGDVEQRSRMEGDGTEASVVVRRFINVWPGETCERNRSDASLTETLWRIVRLGDEPVTVADGKREPQLILKSEKMRFSATVGCNRMVGGYELDGAALRFGNAASTMMACPPPLDGLERKLGQVLTETAGWQVYGQTLELTAADGRPLALLQAVYLK